MLFSTLVVETGLKAERVNKSPKRRICRALRKQNEVEIFNFLAWFRSVFLNLPQNFSKNISLAMSNLRR